MDGQTDSSIASCGNKTSTDVQNVDKLGDSVAFFYNDLLGPVIQHGLKYTNRHTNAQE